MTNVFNVMAKYGLGLFHEGAGRPLLQLNKILILSDQFCPSLYCWRETNRAPTTLILDTPIYLKKWGKDLHCSICVNEWQ